MVLHDYVFTDLKTDRSTITFVNLSEKRMSKINNAIDTTLPVTGYMRLPQVLAVIPIDKTLWWEWVRTGKAPKGIKLSSRVTAWKVEDIKLLIKNLAEQDQDKPSKAA